MECIFIQSITTWIIALVEIYHINYFDFLLKGEFVSMGVISDGNSYGVPDDLIYSFPVVLSKVCKKYIFNFIPE